MVNPLLALLIAALVGGIGALILWPERGLLARWRKAQQMTEHVLSEDALKHIHKCEMSGRHPSLESIAGTLHLTRDATAQLLTNMQNRRLLQIEKGEIRLTPQGRETALHIIRAHRLWEHYLAEETGFAQEEWHGQAEQYEHELTPAQIDALSSRLGNPTHDPHGDPIPTAGGDFILEKGQPLTALPLDTPGRIVHLADEPQVVYAQLVAEGIHPGMVVRVMESTTTRVRFWSNGDEHVLAPIVAGSIAVVLCAAEEKVETADYELLASLEPGETATVVGLSRASRGAERRRFMDLGIVKGTTITAEMNSPGGDPTAYQIRGALIALRREQANLIKIKKTNPEKETRHNGTTPPLTERA